MLAIEIELLGGRYAATEYNDRSKAEWPPHPARFFSALVAALHANETVDPEEREALRWLEQQPSPSLDVDLFPDDERGRRHVLDVYVPVNDISLVGDVEQPLRLARDEVAKLSLEPRTPENDKRLLNAKKLVDRETRKLEALIAEQQIVSASPSKKELKTVTALMPHRRTRQVRTFPVAIPADPRFTFVWPETPPAVLEAAIERLCGRVARLGHSSSLVRCVIVRRPCTPTLVPDEGGETVLRVIGPGQLERLEREFMHHQGIESRVLPSRPQRYGPPRCDPADSPIPSVFSPDWITLERVGGARLLSSRATDLAKALRAALIEQHGARTLPEWLSGHGEDGSPSESPHVAFISLPFVGHPHADASIQGCAIVLPRGLAEAERSGLMRLIAAWERDRVDRSDGTMMLGGPTFPPVRMRRVELSEKVSLNPGTWCGPARRFVTATPIALDRNPGNLRSNLERTAHRASLEAQRSVMEACERIGLPRPLSVEISLTPLLQGAQPLGSYSPWPGQPGRTPRVRVYAEIHFADRIRGPVLLGAGRYFGLGLCLPIFERDSQ
jgi:CRISPR-associated protein Csb2